MRSKFPFRYSTADEVVKAANEIMEAKLSQCDLLTSPNVVKNFLQTLIGNEEREIFVVIHLDNRNRFIQSEKLFFGTIDRSIVYPREVVKSAIKYNAAAAIFAHNHPSGETKPSKGDREVTKRLISALELIDVRVLDHIVVSRNKAYSFAEDGLL